MQTGLDTDALHLNSTGAVGCALSHINAWKEIAASGKASFVMEDDVNIEGVEGAIVEARARLPSDVDFAAFMYLSYGSTKKGEHARLDDHWRLITSRYFSGLQMYYLTPKGARTLLASAFPIVTHIDVYVAYVAATGADGFRGAFLDNNIYHWWDEFKDNLKSTLGHRFVVKRFSRTRMGSTTPSFSRTSCSPSPASCSF